MFSLDVLRGLAIALVLFRHFPPTEARTDGTLESIVGLVSNIGWIGVDLFFVLSGFLISGLIFKEYDRSGGFAAGRFWIRRGFKIWPAYFAAYGGMTVCRIAWEMFRGDQEKASDIASNAACNALFLQNYLPCERWSHSWSLAVEEHFYTVFAVVAGVIFWFGARKTMDGARVLRLLTTLFIAASIVVLYLRWRECFPDYIRNGEKAYSQSHLRMDSLLCGVFLGYVHRYWKASIPIALTRWPVVVAALGSAVAWSALLPSGETPYSESIGLTMIYLSCGIVVASAALNPQFGLQFPRPANVLFRSFAWLGVYSYTIYLAHAVLFGFPGVESLRQGVLAAVNPMLGEALTLWLDRILFLVASVAGGVLLSHAVERPFLRLREAIFPQ
jgi:peptidoglycan/LPS O-acetylase OafA/YrhL